MVLQRLRSALRPLYHRRHRVPPWTWLQRWYDARNPITLANTLKRCRSRLAGPLGTMIDVGASNGSWSLAAKRVFPEARVHLVEAQAVHEPALRDLAARRPDFGYVLAAAGD